MHATIKTKTTAYYENVLCTKYVKVSTELDLFLIFNDLCPPNAFASNYIKRGCNVWKTDLYIKFGFQSGYQQWQDLKCVFSFKEKGIMKIIALGICWNNQYGRLGSKLEQSCTNMHWARKWRMRIPYSRVQRLFLFFLFLRALQPSADHQIEGTPTFCFCMLTVWKTQSFSSMKY